MPGNTFGTIFRVTTWGESHGKAIGGVLDGCPAGIHLSEADIQPALDRRRPGQSEITTSRNESDRVEILSGVFEGKTTGAPLSLIIYNQDQRSEDYEKLKNVHRPQHADEVYELKYGIRDHRGGGRASARETAMRVAAAAVAEQMMKALGHTTRVIGHTRQIQELVVERPDFNVIEQNPVRAANLAVAKQMEARILKLRDQGDSVGATLECTILNAPIGLGEPVFDKFKADLAKAIMSINAVLGFEYGAGFEAAQLTGSQNNEYENGMYGGITNGKPLTFRIALKQTSSIDVGGRHDPCLAPRAVPIVEAMTWL